MLHNKKHYDCLIPAARWSKATAQSVQIKTFLQDVIIKSILGDKKANVVDMKVNAKVGHRERLKSGFVAGKAEVQTDEALLELLLTYAIPQKDVQLLAKKLLASFGSLSDVLAADITALCKHEGIKEHTAILLKLTDLIRKQESNAEAMHVQVSEIPVQAVLFPETSLDQKEFGPAVLSKARPPKSTHIQLGTGLFSRALLKEAIEILPQLPDTESLTEVRAFLRQHLHFSGESTRERYAQYITKRLFPGGYVDAGLRTFAHTYVTRQELRDICFYRFCKAEPLMLEVIENLVLPSISSGQLERSHIRDYLVHRFPSRASTKDCALAIVKALVESGIARADRLTLSFSYRNIALPSFAFILYSEFPEPGMFDIEKVEQSLVFRSLLWKPDALLPMLYELRNRRLIGNVSEIDTVRQFTAKYTLDEVCNILQQMEKRP